MNGYPVVTHPDCGMPRTRCEKCGETFRAAYTDARSGKQSTRKIRYARVWDAVEGQYLECIKVTCRRCHFTWKDYPADALGRIQRQQPVLDVTLFLGHTTPGMPASLPQGPPVVSTSPNTSWNAMMRNGKEIKQANGDAEAVPVAPNTWEEAVSKELDEITTALDDTDTPELPRPVGILNGRLVWR